MPATALTHEQVEQHLAAGALVAPGKGSRKGMYAAHVYCGGCEFGSVLSPVAMLIARGIAVADVKCPECGARLLRRPPEHRYEKTEDYRKRDNVKRREKRQGSKRWQL